MSLQDSNIKSVYSNYIKSINIEGSGKATSYIRAIDLLCEMLAIEPFGFSDCSNVWTVESPSRIHQLYSFVLEERSRCASSPWNNINIPVSYLRDGYCSAALKSFEVFLIEYQYEKKLYSIFESFEGDENQVSNELNVEIDFPEILLENMDKKQGIDIIRETKVRTNQNVFRRMVLAIYNQSCCITGLNIPEVNRASHIVPWAEGKKIRLDPSNGLCLSATYDAAFDKNLISLDDDYRIIISKNISNFYTSESVKEHFIKKEGAQISLPLSYLPNKEYLQSHRSKGDF